MCAGWWWRWLGATWVNCLLLMFVLLESFSPLRLRSYRKTKNINRTSSNGAYFSRQLTSENVLFIPNLTSPIMTAPKPARGVTAEEEKKIILNTHNLWWFRMRKWKTTIHDKFVGNIRSFFSAAEYILDIRPTCWRCTSIFYRWISKMESDRHRAQAGVKKGVKCQSSVRKRKEIFAPTPRAIYIWYPESDHDEGKSHGQEGWLTKKGSLNINVKWYLHLLPAFFPLFR